MISIEMMQKRSESCNEIHFLKSSILECIGLNVVLSQQMSFIAIVIAIVIFVFINLRILMYFKKEVIMSDSNIVMSTQNANSLDS